MSSLAKIAEAPVSAPQTETTAILSMIERAARDPSVDVVKLERLFEMQQKAQEAAAKRAFLAAFSVMQPELPTISRDGKIEIPSKDKSATTQRATPYARWEDIDEACRPIYSAHGFSLAFDIEQTADRITAIAVLAHRDGHERRVPFSSPIESSGFKNNTQGWGSALTYCKRYAGTAVLNIITRGQDDDGKAAGEPPCITEEQAMALRDMIAATDTNEAAFCTYMKAEKVSRIPATDFDRAMAALKKKAGK